MQERDTTVTEAGGITRGAPRRGSIVCDKRVAVTVTKCLYSPDVATAISSSASVECWPVALSSGMSIPTAQGRPVRRGPMARTSPSSAKRLGDAEVR